MRPDGRKHGIKRVNRHITTYICALTSKAHKKAELFCFRCHQLGMLLRFCSLFERIFAQSPTPLFSLFDARCLLSN